MYRYVKANDISTTITVYCANNEAMSQYRHIPAGELGFYCGSKLDTYLHSIGQSDMFTDALDIAPTHVLDADSIDISWTNDSLRDQGYDCIHYITPASEDGYIILDPKIIKNVYNNKLITLREFFADIIGHESIYNLTPSDIVYMTNGVYDTALAYFVDYDVEGNGRDRQYECSGRVIVNLCKSYYHKPQSITNQWAYSSNVEVVSEIPQILIDNPYIG